MKNKMNYDEYITVEQFSKECGKSVRTIKNNWKKIPGASLINGKIMIAKDSRYPFSLRWFNTDDYNQKVFAILKSLFEFKCITNEMIHVNSSDFNHILLILLKIKFIERKKTTNSFGTNMYVITHKGIEFIDNNKKKSIYELASMLGILIGQVINQIKG